MKLRNILFGKYREKVLGNIICNEIEKLKDLNKKKKITIIDYGSGYNPEVINRVIKSLQTKHKKPTLKNKKKQIKCKNAISGCFKILTLF